LVERRGLQACHLTTKASSIGPDSVGRRWRLATADLARRGRPSPSQLAAPGLAWLEGGPATAWPKR